MLVEATKPWHCHRAYYGFVEHQVGEFSFQSHEPPAAHMSSSLWRCSSMRNINDALVLSFHKRRQGNETGRDRDSRNTGYIFRFMQSVVVHVVYVI